MIIKYFGRHEYEELEKIISSVEDLKVNDINFTHTDIPEIYDDLIMRTKIILEADKALFTVKRIREFFMATKRSNVWLTMWRVWKPF